jgi:NADH-quinone oxidoreductase subunit N
MMQVLVPFLVLAVTALVALVGIAVRRSFTATVSVTGAGFVLAFLATVPAASAAPRAVGPLMMVDGLALFVAGLAALLGLACGLLAQATVLRGPDAGEEYHVLLVLAVLGAAALAAAAHVATLLLGLELLSVSLYGLIAHPVSRRGAVEAGLKYLVLAGVSSAILVFGMACVYAGTGTLTLTGITVAAAMGGGPLASAGLVLILVGLFFKLALVPLHMWTPDVYVGAPAPSTALVATVSKGAVVVVLWRLVAPLDLARAEAVSTVLTVAAVASMLVGNLLALRQRGLERILAYSSIAHVGYLLLAVIAGSALGTRALVFYLTAYGLTMTAAFGTLATLGTPDDEATDLERVRGLFWRRPGPALVLTVAMLSLAGMPLTAGFLAKVWVVTAGVSAAWWWPVVALAVGSAISMFYYLRVVLVMAAVEADPAASARPAAMPRLARVVLGVLLAAVVWLGLLPGTLDPVTTAVVGIIP